MVHLQLLTASLCLLSSASAFSRCPSTFTGRASAVASRAELTTELSCPPTRNDFRKGSNMSMPPFLKKLGLKKPGADREEEESSGGAVATLERPDEKDESIKAVEEVEEVQQTGETEKENMMSKIKSAGAAGALSLFLWELAFWAISIPVAIFGFVSVAGSWPDLSDKEDLAKVGAEAFAFANVARLALPVRIGLAVSTTPWVKENIVEAPWAQSIFKKEEE